jgi:hypothetical protein
MILTDIDQKFTLTHGERTTLRLLFTEGRLTLRPFYPSGAEKPSRRSAADATGAADRNSSYRVEMTEVVYEELRGLGVPEVDQRERR